MKCANSVIPIVVTTSGQFIVKVIDTLGCVYSDTIIVTKTDYNIESIDTNYCFGNIFDWRNQKENRTNWLLPF